MAISRMQQPRQMYGLGSFVKKAVRKITRPVTKVASKIVPKEIAGIMRAAAPFLPAGYREAAYLLGTAKQTGRISPMDLALTAAPTFFSKTNVGQGIADRVGNLTLPGMDRNLRQVMVGTPEITSRGPKTFNIPDPVRSPVQPDQITKTLTGFGDPRTVEATSGIFGEGGKFFQFGAKDGPSILDTKAGQTLFGKENEDGTFSPSISKLAGVGIGTLSLLTAAKTPEEAGETLVSATGDPDDYERGAALFSQLTPDLFAVPERFRLTAADGGLTRTNYAMGSDDDKPVLPEDPTKPVNPFQPEPIKPLGDMKMASYDYNDAMAESFAEFQRLKKIGEIPSDMEFDEYLDLLDIDIPYSKKQKDKEGIMMAKKGGRANLALGSRPTAQESGLGGLPIEADMRYTGGFMPYGAKEKADDVPARLSKNEFVFTADAVRAAGGGSVNKGAKKMYATMKQLEKKPEAKGMTA
jgi:hypothetical protein